MRPDNDFCEPLPIAGGIVFFFQAEDGIRDVAVTGVQTCALPISAGRWAVRLVKEADALKVGPREKLAELGRGLAAGAGREPAVAQLFFLQRHGDLLDDESGKVARDFRLGLESLIAQGKADGSVKPGVAEVWAAVWLGVVTLVIDRVTAKQWPENHACVALALDAAWDAIAAARL